MAITSPTIRPARFDAPTTLAILIILYIINTFDRTILSLMVPHVKADLLVSDAQMGLLLGIAFALFYGIFGIPLGVAADRWPRRTVLFGGAAFWSLATIACAAAGTFHQLLGARMALGIGEAALMPAAHSLLSDKFPARRLGTAMSVFYLGGVFGNGLSALIGGIAVSHFSHYPSIEVPLLGGVRGWQFPFVLVGLFGLICSGLVFAFREPARAHHGTPNAGGRSFLQTLSRRKAIAASILGSYVLFSMVVYAAVLWIPTYMTRAFGWTPAQIGPLFSLVNIAGAGPGIVISGMTVDWLFGKGVKDAHLRVFFVCTLIAAPCGIAAFLVTSPYLFLTLVWLLFLFGFAFSGFAAATVQAISPPAVRARMAATYLLLLVIVGSGLGPWFVGLLTDHLFGDEKRVGLSIVVMIAVVSPIALVATLCGMKPMRRAVSEVLDETEALRGADGDRSR